MRSTTTILFLTVFIHIGLFAQDISSNIQIINDYDNKGFDFLQEGKFDSAEYYLLRALQLQTAYYGQFNSSTANTSSNIAVLYRNLNNYKKAIYYLNKAERYYETFEPNNLYLGYIYNNKGNVYFNYADYKEAERYYRYALDFFEENNQTNLVIFGRAAINLYNIFVTQNRITEAIDFLKEIDNKYTYKGISAFERHLILSEAYNLQQNYKLALVEINTAKKIYDNDNELQSNDVPLMKYNYQIGSIYLQLGEFEKAYSYLLQNIYISEANNNIRIETLLRTYVLIANILYIKGDYTNCIFYLENTFKKLEDSEFTINPNKNIINEKYINSDIIDLLAIYAKAAHKQYAASSDMEYLKKSLKGYEQAIDYVKAFRLHMRNEKSVQHETEIRLFIFHEAIRVSIELYQKTGKQDYINKAFIIAENIKSFSLYSEIKNAEAVAFADLPEDVSNYERKLTREIKAYEELLYEEEHRENASNSALAKNYGEKLFQLKDSYNNLLDSLEQNYPKYFELKYNPHFISPPEVQKKLKQGEALVQYALSDSILTIFTIDKENIHVSEHSIAPDFSGQCIDYFNLLQTQDFSNRVHETYRRYIKLSRMFYNTLIKPVAEVTSSKDITFVPAGEIMYLPFEAFLTADIDNEYIDYKNLPYLIHDFSVGYSYSSTILFSERMRTKPTAQKVLAFAPGYKNPFSAGQPINFDEIDSDYLIPLEGARKEVEYISKRVPSSTFMDSLASESNFKKYAPDYAVLHLAMHTILNDENPMFSRLAFSRNAADTTQDQNLFAYEIYNMQLNADMVVLSSCNTGFGKMLKGEGMMSMARGFIYAGCPSIIMTLWQVSDRSSSELMSNFYKHLKKGKTKKDALRKAKIDYLESSDNLKSNPYFWSAFLMVGDNEPVFGTSPYTYLAILLTVFISIVIFISYKKQIKKLINRK